MCVDWTESEVELVRHGIWKLLAGQVTSDRVTFNKFQRTSSPARSRCSLERPVDHQLPARPDSLTPSVPPARCTDMRPTKKTMDTCRFVMVLLSCCVFSGSCFPSRPLNERSTDLAWEAWLLIDDQNQNKQHTTSDGALRRRITPKSVFIAPTFSPELLPACAEGYNSDAMGRCMKIIKIDPDRQYDFLIEKLKEKFSSSFDYDDYEEEEEVGPTQGPFQLDIPLEIDGEGMREEHSEDESEVALIVSPTKANPYVTKLNKVDKRDSALTDEQMQEVYLKRLAETTWRPQEDTAAETTAALSTEPPEEATSTTEATTTFPPSTEDTTTTLTTLAEVPVSTFDPSKMADDPSVFKVGVTESTLHPGIFNRRNRDRHNGLFFLPPSWSEMNHEKPIVLRFSRKSFSPDAKALQNTEFYRSIPTDDFAYLFKFKHKQLKPV